MTLADLLQARVTPDLLGPVVARAAHGDVANRDDVLGLHEAYKGLLCVRWVQLDLIEDRLDAAVAEEICHHLEVEVGYA